MNTEQIKKKFEELQKMHIETEWVEFKEAKKDFDFGKLGKYFSALSNEANLENVSEGWLIFGVSDKLRNIVGTSYRISKSELENLKHEIAEKTTSRITFIGIYELHISGKRVLLFQVPAAPKGIPVAWEGHYYGRDGNSLSPLNIQEIEQIRNEFKSDWSVEICEGASLNDLDVNAILKARTEYKIKNKDLASDVASWDDITFLNKAKVTIEGKITRTAIILLGKPESEHFIGPSIAKISWILKDEHNVEKDYEHFEPPFILNTDAVRNKIRNLKYRYLPDNTLFPIEITQYEPYVIREALHNCIAHQDYELRSRIIIIEKPEELIFTNAGEFIPGNIESVIETDSPPKYYRNQFLATAMVNLNMIDTVGGGIRKMFIKQRERYFPLPTYKLDINEEVTVKIYGKVLDENYTRLLMKNTELDLKTIILLDKVQKGEKLIIAEFKILKKQGLLEGRYPKIFVTQKIAAITGERATYIKNRAFDKEHYKKMVIEFINKFGSASRKDVNKLIFNKLSDILDEKQKRTKISNLINEMANKDKKIKNIGSFKKSKWVLT
ncbi:MAG: transcriptional regulator [Elusimicrobia bacterium RIFOXYD2_FULL_34_15]|nr:MAG: transcriptional regulator [Elusimicrobia bacterium RIFOXYD2_FULL_34_15]HAM39530.1 transcriptional regulator [Elusimicrobiota bacterium]